MEKIEKNKVPRVPLVWLDARLEDLKFSYYDLARLYSHDKEQANSAISILNRYYRAVESYFQWLSWDKNLAKKEFPSVKKYPDGTYEIGDTDELRHMVPLKTQYMLFRAIDMRDYYKMGLDEELKDTDATEYYQLLDLIWPDDKSGAPRNLNINNDSLSIINTIRGINLDEESRKSENISEALDVIREINDIESATNRLKEKEKRYFKSIRVHN